MLNGIIKNMRKTSTVTAIAAALAVSAAGAPALAATLTATGGPTQVEYPGGLIIQFAAINYYAPLSSPCAGIPGQSFDTQKAWLTLAQASLLSGKNLRIDYLTCSGGSTRYIVGLVLLK